MNKAIRLALLTTVIIGFTFSYSILDAILPEFIPNHLLITMSLWTAVMLISYSIYTWVTSHKIVPPSIHWRIQSKASIIPPMAVLLLGILAILFPSLNHDHSDMLYIVGVAVIGEEILFRGLLWDLIETNIGDKIFLNWSDTIWLTGLAFGIMHLQYHHFQVNLVSIVQMSYTFVMGLLLGVIRVGTKSVVQPMFVHSAFNSIFNLILTAVP